MNRIELKSYISQTYGATGEYLFAKSPSFEVFRHTKGRKWFAVIMDIPGKYLGLTDAGEISVVNLKCDPRLADSFRREPGFFPSWHMNKTHWITVALDGTVPDDRLEFLLCMSFELTQ